MADLSNMAPLPTAQQTLMFQQVHIHRVSRDAVTEGEDEVSVEEPLEIELEYGEGPARIRRSISVTMRTPGHDEELALGFLITEGVMGEEVDREDVTVVGREQVQGAWGVGATTSAAGSIRLSVAEGIGIRTGSLERNFYTTSSCGVCGKASLLALRSVSPPRRNNQLTVSADVLRLLPDRMRQAQGTFKRTGGLHAAALFDRAGNLRTLREDVGRHNAVDKLIGEAFLTDELPLRERILLLSGRVSFELMQKAVMGGIAMVLAIGAPSSLAIQVAKDFDVTLIGFLRDDHFNIYNGAERILR